MTPDFLAVLDVSGIFVFALSGCVVAMRHRMDLVGVFTLGFVSGFGGGIARDVLIGDLPPQVVRTGGLLLVPLLAGVVALAVPHLMSRLRPPVLVLDAIGLGLFATVGASKALGAGLGIVPAMLIGTISAVGGGLVRDLLAGEVPQILSAGSRLYAIPAALGALLVGIGSEATISSAATQLVAVAVTVVLRLAAMRYGWHAPVPERIVSRYVKHAG